jgi:hypothetical protein
MKSGNMMMMSSNEPPLELMYFPIHGRAFPLRMIYAYAGRKNFTDTQVQLADWGSVKPTLP